MKIINITVSPSTIGDEVYNAGVMYEHNATKLVFSIDQEYINSDYRYYLDFATPTGVLRTEYLTPQSDNTISFLLPVNITDQMSVMCYFNIVSIDSVSFNTTSVIKPKVVMLNFSTVVGTDDRLREQYDFSVNTLLEAIENNTFKGDKGDKGEKGDKGDKGEKGDKGDSSVIVDTTMSDTSENPVQNKVIKAYVDGKKTSFIIDCPVFTNQPTITGSLNSAFKIWYENYYYVHILDEAAGTFGLMELRSDTTTLIDQTFTLSGLNTGNAGVLRENSPIDFLSIGDSWQMRSAGVNSVTPTNLNAKRLDISINGYANESGYFSISYINGNSKFNDVKFNNGRFGVYTGDQGFVLGGSAINSKNVYLSAKFGMEINKKHINISGDYTALRMSDDNLFGYYTPITMLDYPINASGVRSDFGDLTETAINRLNFSITYGYVFRNGTEIIFTVREGA